MPTDVSKILVLYGYLGAHFQRLEKPKVKGETLGNRKFFIEGGGGVNERGWRGFRSLLKPPPPF